MVYAMKKRKYTITYLGEMSCRSSNYLVFEIEIQWNSNKNTVQIKIPRKSAKERAKIDIWKMNDREKRMIYAYALLEIKDSITQLETDKELKVMFNYKDSLAELSSIGWSVDDFIAKKPLYYP